MFGGSFSILHWIVVLAVVLLLFGGRGKVSAIMGDFGKGLRNFKTGLKGPDGDAGEDDAAEAIEELSNIKNIGGDAGQQIASATAPAKTQAKTSKAKSARNKKS